MILLGNRVVAGVFSSDEAMLEEDGFQMQYYWHLIKRGNLNTDMYTQEEHHLNMKEETG